MTTSSLLAKLTVAEAKQETSAEAASKRTMVTSAGRMQLREATGTVRFLIAAVYFRAQSLNTDGSHSKNGAS